MVKQCQGAITIDSKVGHGTTISMFFPRAKQEFASYAEGGVAESEHLEPVRPGAKLLIVDDDPDVREFAAMALREGGYQVVEANDAEAGLDLIKHDPEIALLITDYAMPFITGVDLFRRARMMRPDLSALLITGFANLPEDQAITAMHILRKPFDLPDVLQAVNRCLDRAPLVEAA
jgi:DNA-binding NtrC family response regulator